MRSHRLALSIAALVALAAPIGAQSITVMKPNGGESLDKGSKAAILWKYSGLPDIARVRLVLFRNGSKLGIIADNVPVTVKPIQPGFGALPSMWTVGEYQGGSAPAGGNYVIRVRTMDNAVQGDSAPFSIASPQQKVFGLLSPKGGESWALNSVQKIRWTCTGYTGQLLIKLYQAGTDWGAIESGVSAGAGSLDWKVGDRIIGHTFTTGDKYAISIEPVTKTAGGPNKFVSKWFTITVPEYTVGLRQLGEQWAPRQVKFTSPAPGPGVVGSADRTVGFTVTWECSENMKGEYASMTLLGKGQSPRLLLPKFPLSLGKHLLTLYSDVPLGEYRLRIQALSFPEVQAESGAFNLLPYEKTVQSSIQAETRNPFKYYHANPGEFTADCLQVPVPPDPGPHCARVGRSHRRNGKEDSHDICYFVFRSHVKFDLQYEQGQVLEAVLTYSELDTPPGHPVSFHVLTAPWNGDTNALFGIPCTPVGERDFDQWRQIAQNWIDHPEQNYGLVIVGDDETFGIPPTRAYHVMKEIRLQLKRKVVE